MVRQFSRAKRMQDCIEPGLRGDAIRKSTTLASSGVV
jgi:hypothetical protein